MDTKVAILLTNNDDSPFSLRFPNDGEKVAAQLQRLRPQWECRVWSVKDDEFPARDEADAFVITGSPASVNDPFPWIKRLTRLVREIEQDHRALVGLCFGHQLIAKALGGTVEFSASGWRFGAIDTEYSTAQPWMVPVKSRLRLFASHAEQVTQLPASATLLGSAVNCRNASYCIGAHVLTTQYHPEFGREFMKALAAEYRGEVAPDVLEHGENELDSTTDGPLFFEWVAKFIDSALASQAVPK